MSTPFGHTKAGAIPVVEDETADEAFRVFVDAQGNRYEGDKVTHLPIVRSAEQDWDPPWFGATFTPGRRTVETLKDYCHRAWGGKKGANLPTRDWAIEDEQLNRHIEDECHRAAVRGRDEALAGVANALRKHAQEQYGYTGYGELATLIEREQGGGWHA